MIGRGNMCFKADRRTLGGGLVGGGVNCTVRVGGSPILALICANRAITNRLTASKLYWANISSCARWPLRLAAMGLEYTALDQEQIKSDDMN